MENLRKMIIDYRAKERINQEEFAQRCGISRRLISAIENGKYSPSPVTEAKIRIVVDSKEG